MRLVQPTGGMVASLSVWQVLIIAGENVCSYLHNMGPTATVSAPYY